MKLFATGVVRNNAIVPDWKLDLPEGADVVVEIEEITHEERLRLIAEHAKQAQNASQTSQ